MVAPHPPHRFRRTLLVGALVAAALVGCGARSGIELLEGTPVSAGGAASSADPSLPAQGGQIASAAGGGAGGAINSRCESVTVSIDDLRPAITLVVDQSRSMRNGFPTRTSPNTRWSLVGQALFDPSQGVVKTFESSVRFGIAFFTGHRGSCPLLNEVSAATGNYDALNVLYRHLGPDGDTPTGASLERIVTELQSSPPKGPQSIVLVTDGNPDTCEQPQPDNGQPQAVAAVQRAHAAGFDVYVIGISNDIAGENLQQLANAGKGKPLDLVWGTDADAAQPYQASSDLGGLSSQLGDIISSIPFCEVRLQRDVDTDEASAGQVVLDGQTLAYSPNDGFVLEDPRHLAIVGKPCDAIRSNGKELTVRISCN